MALRHVLLALLATRPSHPYELKRRVSPGLPPGNRLNDGVLYPLLARLEREGLVDKREVKAETGRTRHVFETTADGRDDLLAWLRDPDVDAGEPAYDFVVGHPLVKLLFADRLTSDERRTLLDAATQRTSDAIAVLERLREAPPPDLDTPAGQAFMALLIEQRRAELKFLAAQAATGASAGQ